MKRRGSIGCGLAALLLGGCSLFTDNVVTVTAVDGSNDHRIFRLGALSELMFEPVLWNLEDAGKIDLDRPVSAYFRGRLPPAFDKITMRDLHDHRSGLPQHIANCWSLEKILASLEGATTGLVDHRGCSVRAEFVSELWTLRLQNDVRLRSPGHSDAGYALMMMAVCDRMRMTPQELLERYVIEPYGLKDTAFSIRDGHRSRLTRRCAGKFPCARLRGEEIAACEEGIVVSNAVGMVSSASDVLKVAYVIMPHLDRCKGMLTERRLDTGRRVWYCEGTAAGGGGFVGFDPADKRAVAILGNTGDSSVDAGLRLLESLGEGVWISKR